MVSRNAWFWLPFSSTLSKKYYNGDWILDPHFESWCAQYTLSLWVRVVIVSAANLRWEINLYLANCFQNKKALSSAMTRTFITDADEPLDVEWLCCRLKIECAKLCYRICPLKFWHWKQYTTSKTHRRFNLANWHRLKTWSDKLHGVGPCWRCRWRCSSWQLKRLLIFSNNWLRTQR